MQRRDFLRISAATTAALSIGAISPETAFAADNVELTRPYREFLRRGLCVGSWVTTPAAGRYFPTGAEWSGSNLTTPTFYERDFFNEPLMASLPDKTLWSIAAYPRDEEWGKLTRGPRADEQILWSDAQRANARNLFTFNVGDEELYSEQMVEWMRQWFDVIREQVGGHVLVHNNQTGLLWPEDQLQTYIEHAKPDLLTTDWYHFQSTEPYATGNMSDAYDDMAHYRRVALTGLTGDGRQPIAYGHYSQGFKGGGENYDYVPSESELAFLYFMAWTMGARWVMLFRWERESSVFLFYYPDGRHTPQYGQIASIAAQSRRLSPYLVRFLAQDVRFVTGRHRDATGAVVANRKPEWIESWTPGCVPGLADVSGRNVASANDGLPGDVLVGSFQPLPGLTLAPYRHAFMILNGLIAPNPGGGFDATGGFARDTVQEVSLTLDRPSRDANRLFRISRTTGRPEAVPLRRLSSSQDVAEVRIGGGFADLFLLA